MNYTNENLQSFHFFQINVWICMRRKARDNQKSEKNSDGNVRISFFTFVHWGIEN